MAVATVDYRLYPSVTCPTYIEDAAASVAWVVKHIKRYGGNPNLVFVSGHSAGGYLTSMVDLDKRWLAPHNLDPDDLAPVFSDVERKENLTFGTATNQAGHEIELQLDIYQPRGDTVKNRPTILWIHGGGFRPGNDK